MSAAEEVESALKLLTRKKKFRADDPIRSYNGSTAGSPVQPTTPPRTEFDDCKSPKLLAMFIKANKAKSEKANNANFGKFCERVENAGVRPNPS